MYENLNGISINGQMLDKKRNFNLFESDEKNIYPTRFSLVYGKNGSGKSTITKGFQKLREEFVSSIESAELYDFNDSVVNSFEEKNKNIFVFNEHFIEQNVKFKEDGLETIVMFGEQADLEEKIKSLNQQIIEKREQFKVQNIKSDEFDDSRNVISPLYHLKKINKSLKGDGNWAGRDGKIRGHRINSSVNQAIIDKIKATEPKIPKQELQKKYEEKITEFNHLNGNGKKIGKNIPKVNFTTDIKKVHNLLKKKIEKPKLSDREKNILELVISGKQKDFEEVRDMFLTDEVDHCPTCLQSISESYKVDLVNSIEKVLNDDVDNHISELSSIRMSIITLDLSEFSIVDATTVQECIEQIEEANIIIENYNDLIQKKIDNTYSPINDEFLLLDKIDLINKCLASIENSKDKYNKKFDELDSLKNELFEINDGIAYFDIIEDYNAYVEQKNTADRVKKSLITITKEGEKLAKSLESIEEEQKNIKIAVDFINNGLKYVFFSDRRLSIEPKEDRYVLSSNGRLVKPQDISCGERNILALCYYFTLTMNKLNEEDFYKKEVLLIIDDPVSSFDLENRIGIMSYLKSQLLKVALGNLNSRVVVFSHDLPTVYDLYKQFEEIQAAVKVQNNENKNNYTTKFSVWELEKFELKKFSYRKRHEYSLMIKTIYDYAINGLEEDNLAIGNIMRRVLEAFSSFEYKKGIDSISCDPNILSSMGNEEYSLYFENLMYRLILHGESHLEEHIKSLQDLNFYSTVSVEEKRRTAKDVLCLIYVLNPKHLTAHLDGNKKKISDIESWCTDILSSKLN